MNANDYRILGITEGASTADIRAAYRKLARKFHPDSNPSNPARAAKQFAALKSAHDRLLAAPRQAAPRPAPARPKSPVPAKAKKAQPNAVSPKRSGDAVDDMMADIIEDIQTLYKGVSKTFFRRSKERV